MNIPQLILSIVDVAAAIFLIAVVLLQSGKSAGLSGAMIRMAMWRKRMRIIRLGELSLQLIVFSLTSIMRSWIRGMG